MRVNENTLLEGKLTVLVPYNPEHVPRYHKWMKSEELQKLTASEPLTLEQEYEMQCSWREDADKTSYRGRGFGKEATVMMLQYGVTKLGITKFEAKIGLENVVSISMFKAFHFGEVSVSEVFQEMTLQLVVDEEWLQWLLEKADFVKQNDYRKTRQQIREIAS